MNLDDVLALVHAGFNAQQIAAFAAQPTTAPAAPPAVALSSAPEQEPEMPRNPAPKADGNADTTVIKTAPTMEEITALITGSIDKLSNRIDAMNIRNSEQPKAETVDDILASIINPKTK